MPALFLAIASLIVVYIAMGLAARHFFGYVGVVTATALTNVLVGLISVWWNPQTLMHE
ncbi:MAG: hypothetical protein OSB45_15615 [Pseudomonadales bacterium]|jgi:hypothetical protein|nr:hypothetical protein [Pseudomonadales bacterium]